MAVEVVNFDVAQPFICNVALHTPLAQHHHVGGAPSAVPLPETESLDRNTQAYAAFLLTNYFRRVSS